MGEIVQAFKVVDHRGRIVAETFRDFHQAQTFTSCSGDGHVVSYQIGGWTERPEGCGPLAIFEDLDACIGFLYKCGWSYIRGIFHCEAELSNDHTLWTPVHEMDVPIPSGTLFAERVKITELSAYTRKMRY